MGVEGLGCGLVAIANFTDGHADGGSSRRGDRSVLQILVVATEATSL